LGLKNEKAKTVGTPGVRIKAEDLVKEEMLGKEEATMYRACVARANYLGQDRSDIQYAVKELCRRMSEPTMNDWIALKRLGRYLLGHGRYVVKFGYQGPVGSMSVWTDTDYAGCLRTRKSTTGGVLMIGEHTIKGWSTTQSVIALSSGEAEYYGMVRGGSIGMGIKALGKDLGVDWKVRILTDASAAHGIANRWGLGKVRHLETCQLWLQKKVADGEIEVEKVKGTENPADALTKHLGTDDIKKHIQETNGILEPGRHSMMPKADGEKR
jgi:hypothetical protein